MRRSVLFGSICVALIGCSKKDTAVDQSKIQPMLGAVMYADTDKVRKLAEQHIGLEERYPPDQSTPMVWAAKVDQWPLVEILIDHGADIWAYNQFGITAAQRTTTSRIRAGSIEDEARLRVMEKLKARGYPFPPPDRATVLAFAKSGNWPPHGARN